jgi:hypothetical protein
MRDSNVANAAKESTQNEFSHGLYVLQPLLFFCRFRVDDAPAIHPSL